VESAPSLTTPSAAPVQQREPELQRQPTERQSTGSPPTPAPQPAEPQRHRYVLSEANQAYWSDVLRSFGGATHSLDSAYIVLTLKDDGSVLATTNYLRENYVNAPIARFSASALDDETAFAALEKRLLGTSNETGLRRVKLKFVLDGDANSPLFKEGVFDKKDQTFKFPTDGFRSAAVHFAGSSEGFVAEKFDRPSGASRWVAKLNDCCVVSGIPTNLPRWRDLGNIPFSRERASVISLVWDSETAGIMQPFARRAGYAHPDSLRDDPLNRIRKVFESGAPGDPVVVLGHAEGGNFVVERNGQFQFKVPFSALTDMATATRRPVIFLGCYTANYFAQSSRSSADYAVGTLNLLRSGTAARRLAEAMSGATTLQQFLAGVSSRDQYIWVSNLFLDQPEGTSSKMLRAPIFQEGRNERGIFRSIVGFLFVSIPCALVGGCA
jgi:hypothetical protein